MLNEGENELWIRVPDPDAHLPSLLDWLRREDALRRGVHPRHAPLGEGQMGGALDALAVAVGSGGMGAVLANCLSAWISQRRSDVRITLSTRDGRTIEVDAKGVDPRSLAKDVERLLDRGDQEAGGEPS
ncbi:hypothetical protein JS756_32310 [Streptomyces actuosus]|uniref:Uncharacterized protein n=1 Tax=Streptomyces actuosus TaxID=1885 RepID=A0ABS2W088_STRAS|nr:hypothetical protein [Streptomyces actuosus]MBN0048694.1 hypothetical protein [Streptomyces actuosus]